MISERFARASRAAYVWRMLPQTTAHSVCVYIIATIYVCMYIYKVGNVVFRLNCRVFVYATRCATKWWYSAAITLQCLVALVHALKRKLVEAPDQVPSSSAYVAHRSTRCTNCALLAWAVWAAACCSACCVYLRQLLHVQQRFLFMCKASNVLTRMNLIYDHPKCGHLGAQRKLGCHAEDFKWQRLPATAIGVAGGWAQQPGWADLWLLWQQLLKWIHKPNSPTLAGVPYTHTHTHTDAQQCNNWVIKSNGAKANEIPQLQLPHWQANKRKQQTA